MSTEQLATAFDQMTNSQRVARANAFWLRDDAVQRMKLVELIGNGDVYTTAVATGQEALSRRRDTFDCIVLDLKTSRHDRLRIDREVQKDPAALTANHCLHGQELTRKEEYSSTESLRSISIQRGRFPRATLAETALFLASRGSKSARAKRRMLEQVKREDPVLSDRTVLIVDDDVRNIFALTSTSKATL